MPYQETRRAVLLVCVQRRMGLHPRLFAACARFCGFGARRKGILAARCCAISEIEAAIRVSGSALPSWLFVLWSAWDRKDFTCIRTGRELWNVHLYGQSGGFQRS